MGDVRLFTLTLPEDVESIIASHVDPEEDLAWMTLIEGALWEMRARAIAREPHYAGLREKLRESLNPVTRGEGADVTPEFWEHFNKRIVWDVDRITSAQDDAVGNVVLPEELFKFVIQEIKENRFASPSDVVSAAVRSCAWDWTLL